MNIEYEYSFEVPSLAPFIEYCQDNNYTLTSQSEQKRTIYRDKNRTFMARITENDCNGVITKQLDFKEDKLVAGQIVGERKETQPLEFSDDAAVLSILDFLSVTVDNTLIRKRQVYQKGDVKFELDEYSSPRHTFVVGIEGEKFAVDKVYSEVKDFPKLN